VKDSRKELASYFRTIDVMAGVLVISVIEAFLLQRWRELEFLLLIPNLLLFAVLIVVIGRRYVRYLRAYIRESRMQNPSARWYQRLQYNPTGSKQRFMWASLILGAVAALAWTAVLIAHAR
jgi:hypothetical protein